jgi:hypothetical protein
MRVFLISCVAVVVLAVGAFLSLSTVQKPSGTRWTTEGARIHPSWSFRQVFSKAKVAPTNTMAMAMPSGDGTEEGCGVSNAWAMILADFSSPATADEACGN